MPWTVIPKLTDYDFADVVDEGSGNYKTGILCTLPTKDAVIFAHARELWGAVKGIMTTTALEEYQKECDETLWNKITSHQFCTGEPEQECATTTDIERDDTIVVGVCVFRVKFHSPGHYDFARLFDRRDDTRGIAYLLYAVPAMWELFYKFVNSELTDDVKSDVKQHAAAIFGHISKHLS